MASAVSPLWRWAVTDLDGATITFLDKLASDRLVTPKLNEPLELTGTVPSDSPEINQLHTDNLPFLAEGVRQLYGFRREYDTIVPGDPPEGHGYYRVRASTLILQTDDTSRTEDARTRFTAWDPWQYLFYRPIYVQIGESYGLIPRKGHTYLEENTPDAIVQFWLYNMLASADFSAPQAAWYGFIDWGWSPFYGSGGTGSVIETIPAFPDGYHIEPGTSIGQAMQDMCATGCMDIVMTPIHDPINRPGILCEMSILKQDSDPDSGAGIRNYEAVFAWDRIGRSLVHFDDLIDGTQRANTILFRNGGAGPIVTPIPTDYDSIATYGEYWAEQSFPEQTQKDAVLAIASEQLALRKTFKQTLTVSPAPERSPEPFVDYYLGDRVPIYIGTAQRGVYQLGDNSSRQPLPSGYTGVPPVPDPSVYVWQRIYGIPIEIDDNGTETVRELLVGPIGPPPPVGGGGGGGAERSSAGGSSPGLGLTAAVAGSGGSQARVLRRGTMTTSISPFRGSRGVL